MLNMLRYRAIACVTYIFVKFVDVATVWALFVRVADGFDVQTASLQVIIVASVSKEFAMTEGTEFVWFGKLSTRQRSFGFQEIGAILSFTEGAPLTVAGMILVIVMVESSVALVAEVGCVQEPLEGITPVVVPVFLDQPDHLVGGWT